MPRSDKHSRHVYQRTASFYDFIDWPFETWRYRSLRPLLFRGLNGRLLDAGVGTGRNIAFYPPDADVVGVDLSPAMLDRAVRRRTKLSSSVRLIQMDLTALSFPDGHFDAAIASFVFCTIPEKERATALRELARVIGPSGRIRLLEYAPAQTIFGRVLARVWQPWVSWAFAANLGHDIEADLPQAGLTVIRSRYVTSSIKIIEAAPAT